MKIEFLKDVKSGKKGMVAEVSETFGKHQIDLGNAKEVDEKTKVTYSQYPKKEKTK